MSKVIRLSDKMLSRINEFKNIYITNNDISNRFLESMDDVELLDYIIFFALESLKDSENP